MPKVSVVIPVYGVEHYIERCARSLFEQSLDDIEYLFIDDCSPDNSIDILLRVLNDYPRRKSQVIIHKMERNSGQARVREWGMCNATGDFLTHCDSDDWVKKDAYRILYETAINDDADIVVCDYSMTDGYKVYRNICGKTVNDKEEYIDNLLFQRDPWSLCNKLFRRTTCYKDGLIYPEGNMGEDMVLTFQMIFNGNRVAYVPQSLYNYYYNVNSITHNPSIEKQMGNFWQYKANVDLLIKVFRENGVYEKYSDGIEYVKWCQKKLLWSMPYNKERNEIWKKTYKEIHKHILSSNHITIQEKMKFVLSLIGFYPRRKGVL